MVVTFGEIMLRLSAPNKLRLTQSSSFDVSFAGSEANVAVSLSNYGINSRFVSRFPNNDISKLCLSTLKAMDVDVSHSIWGGERLGILYLETGSDMRPSKVTYDRKFSAFGTISKNDINWEDTFSGATWLHWSGISPALSDSAAGACLEALRVAKSLDVTISCDLNHRNNLWDYGKKAIDVMPELIKYCDVIIGNEEDCEKCFGIKPDANTSSGYESVCRQMAERFPNLHTIALSNRTSINANFNRWRAFLYNKNTFFTSKEYEITNIVDRVGAGDSFAGALIYGLLGNRSSLQESLEFATAASCIKHTIMGDYNRVSVSEIENLLSGSSDGRIKR